MRVIDLVVATFAFPLVIALLTAGLVAVTVLPVYLALQLADNRGFSTGRCTAVTVLGVLIGLAGAYAAHKRDGAPAYAALLPLVMTYFGPMLLLTLSPAQTRVGGRAGLHQ